MNRQVTLSVLLLSALAATLAAAHATAQQPQPKRTLDPTVLTTIPPAPDKMEVFSGPRQLPGFSSKDFTPNYEPKSDTLFERNQHTIFVHKIWNLEFTFKPLRMMEVDIPQDNLKMQKKTVWYIVYKVVNNGNVIAPTVVADEALRAGVLNELDQATLTNRFFPFFVMEAWIQDPETGQYIKREYPDKLIPAAVEKIRDVELLPSSAKPMLRDDKGEFVLDHHGRPAIVLNNVQISQVSIPLSDENVDNGVWGVVTWEDANPAIDFASIFVQGLTNAFEFNEVDGKKYFRHKTLQLNFWRPGDRREELKDAIQYGVPLVNNAFDQVKLFKLYQIPGPAIACYDVDVRNNHEALVFRVDGAVDAKLDVTARIELDSGNIPPTVAQGFARAGITLPPTVTLNKIVNAQWWEMNVDVDGKTKLMRLRYEPQHWNIDNGRIEILRPIDYLWVYRDMRVARDLD